jgi:hypothetical protein
MVTFARSRKALVLCASAMLGSCGGQNGASNAPAVPSLAVPAGARAAGGCPSANCIIVANGPRFRGQTGNILFYPKGADKDAPPVRKIGGSKTGLENLAGIASDSRGSLYVVNVYPIAIEVFATDAQGNVAPIRTIAGSKTLLRQSAGIAIDGSDYLYVVNQKPASIAIFAPDTNGNVAPVRVISGKKTHLDYPWGVAFDSSGNLYVSNSQSVTVYAPGANGDVKPVREIRGPDTELSASYGIALDDLGYVYVVSGGYWYVTVYAPGAHGDATPIRACYCGFYGPVGIAVDANRRLYVSNVGYDDPPHIRKLATTVSGYSGTSIAGKETRLGWPVGILVR